MNIQKRISKEKWVSKDEFFVTSFLTIDLIRKRCKETNSHDAWKAIDLFLFYAKCSSIQETKKVFCSVRFASNWLWYSTWTITKYKKALEDIGCIEQIRDTDDNGKVKWRYINVKFAIKEGVSTSEMWVDPHVGTEIQNAGWVKEEMLDEEKETNSATEVSQPVFTFEMYWNSYPNKKWKAKAIKLFKKKIKTKDKFDQLMKWLEWYKANYKDKKASWDFCPEYQMWDTFLSKETWIDYLDYSWVSDTLEFALEQSLHRINMNILHDYLDKNEPNWKWDPKRMTMRKNHYQKVLKRVYSLWWNGWDLDQWDEIRSRIK